MATEFMKQAEQAGEQPSRATVVLAGASPKRVGYTVLRAGQVLDLPVTLAAYPLWAIAGKNWGTILYALVFLVIALYVFARRPTEPAARIIFFYASAILSATTWSLGMQASDLISGAGFWLYQITTIGAFFLFWIFGLHFVLIFPRPLAMAASRSLLAAMYAIPFLLLIVYLLWARTDSSNTLDWLSRWGFTTNVHAAIFLPLTLAVAGWQYRANRHGEARQQMRWVLLAGLMTGGLGFLLYLLPPLFGHAAVDPNLMGAIITIFPLALAVAILRHNLFDIDNLLNRAAVYGMLTACIIAIYVLIVGGLGSFFQARGDFFVSLVATGLAAVAFHPLRSGLQQWVDRIFYGDRNQPYAVLARLGQRLEAALSPETLLPTLVETVADALRLPYVAIVMHSRENAAGLSEDDEEHEHEVVAEYGKPVTPANAFALSYQGQQIGMLWVAPRVGDAAFTTMELQLLDTIARQAGTAVYAARVTEQLRHSRRRILTAREEERRRLRRDIHDGLGSQLASLPLTVDAIEKLLDKDPAAARALLQAIKHQGQEVIKDVRRLVYELRPPVLDELGLFGALQESVARYASSPVRFHVSVPAPLPELPAAVEVAALRIVQEAISNVVRHAQAQNCGVRLAMQAKLLVVEASDDGRGLYVPGQAGVGLQSMQERAAELDGCCIIDSRPNDGTRIVAKLPI